MDEFLASRAEEPVVKEREHALQSLDLAYHKYKDISRHLEEGLQVSIVPVSSGKASELSIEVLQRSLRDLDALSTNV